MPAPKRQWSLATAQQMLADVRARTERAYGAVEERLEKRERSEPDSEQRATLDAEVREIVSGWAREMEALGLLVKGPWLVDFDTGKGLYCWRWPEQKLEYFHGYDEGFEGRIRIQ